MSDRIILRTGEALVEGDADYLCAEPEIVIGELDGPVGTALANLIGSQVKGHTKVFAILNAYPYTSGHLMIVPYEHQASLASIDEATTTEMIELAKRAQTALEAEYHPNGFNIGMNLGKPAGAGVPDHLHMHVVPRWNGDTNFMPVTAETKVLPETLDQTYDRLAPYFQS